MTTSPGVNVTILDLDPTVLPVDPDTTYIEVVYYDTNGEAQSGKLSITQLKAVLALVP